MSPGPPRMSPGGVRAVSSRSTTANAASGQSPNGSCGQALSQGSLVSRASWLSRAATCPDPPPWVSEAQDLLTGLGTVPLGNCHVSQAKNQTQRRDRREQVALSAPPRCVTYHLSPTWKSGSRLTAVSPTLSLHIQYIRKSYQFCLQHHSRILIPLPRPWHGPQPHPLSTGLAHSSPSGPRDERIWGTELLSRQHSEGGLGTMPPPSPPRLSDVTLKLIPRLPPQESCRVSSLPSLHNAMLVAGS